METGAEEEGGDEAPWASPPPPPLPRSPPPAPPGETKLRGHRELVPSEEPGSRAEWGRPAPDIVWDLSLSGAPLPKGLRPPSTAAAAESGRWDPSPPPREDVRFSTGMKMGRRVGTRTLRP